jgi:hypothetical protein
MKYSYSTTYHFCRKVMKLFGGDGMNIEATYLFEFFIPSYGDLMNFTTSVLDLAARM